MVPVALTNRRTITVPLIGGAKTVAGILIRSYPSNKIKITVIAHRSCW